MKYKITAWHTSRNSCYGQNPPMAAKIKGWKFQEKQDLCICILTASLPGYFLITKGKPVTRETWQTLPDQEMKVCSTSNGIISIPCISLIMIHWEATQYHVCDILAKGSQPHSSRKHQTYPSLEKVYQITLLVLIKSVKVIKDKERLRNS